MNNGQAELPHSSRKHEILLSVPAAQAAIPGVGGAFKNPRGIRCVKCDNWACIYCSECRMCFWCDPCGYEASCGNSSMPQSLRTGILCSCNLGWIENWYGCCETYMCRFCHDIRVWERSQYHERFQRERCAGVWVFSGSVVPCYSVDPRLIDVCQINGNNGEATNTDDLDQADRVRNGHLVKTNRYRRGLNNRGGRVQYGPRPVDKSMADFVNNRSLFSFGEGREEEKELEKEMCVIPAKLYYKKKSRFPFNWVNFLMRVTLIAGCLFIFYVYSYDRCVDTVGWSFDRYFPCVFDYLLESMFALFQEDTHVYVLLFFCVAIWLCVRLFRALYARIDGGAFDSNVPHDASFAELSSWNLRSETANHLDFYSGNFNSFEIVDVSMKYIECLRTKHSSIRCNVNTVDVLMSTLCATFPNDVVLYWSIMNNSALVYYQEKLRASVRREHTSHHQNIFPVA